MINAAQRWCLPVLICLFLYLPVAAQQKKPVGFVKHIITKDFISEGAALADVNRDGKTDIIAGAYWFEAPTWIKHGIAQPKTYNPATEFSNSFLNFAMDVDQDGWIDQLRISLPGEEAVWYHNPGKQAGYWPMHGILANAGNESPALEDVDGDGRPDLICNDPVAKEMVWMKSPVVKGDTNWKRYVIARGAAPGTNRYTHGLGLTDMNGDGHKDIVITSGWWECPADPTQPDWVFHAAALGADCSQIYQWDSRTDAGEIIINASAHDYGIWWHQRVSNGDGSIQWQQHLIFDKFSETHALTMADINKDGYPDLVTGKRYFAHNGKDPGGMDPAVLYWFEYVPGKQPSWIPHPVDDNSGVGLQVLVQDMNNDGLPDIVVSNKKGLFLFEQTSR